MCEICEFGSDGKPIVDCDRYKALQADLNVWKTAAEEQGKATTALQAELEKEKEAHTKWAIIAAERALEIGVLEIKLDKLRWIPVSEGLPEDDSDILISANCVFIGRYRKFADYCDLMFCDEDSPYDLDDVTHWMPITLPEKPKPEAL